MSYLYKHFAKRGPGFVRSAVHRHGLPVSGKFQCELLFHQLLNHLTTR